MQIRSSGRSYLASSLTELGQICRSVYPYVLAIEIYFALRVAWFTVLSCKSSEGFENLRMA